MRCLALLAMFAACGGDDPVRHLDGGITDSHVVDFDAPPPIPVMITVTRGGQPNAGVTVYFQNADSGLVATKQTDSTGTASQVMNAGGFVTAVDPFVPAAGLPAKTIRTFAGVKPGDHLKLDKSADAVTQVNVIGPVESDASLSFYEITSTCSSSLVVSRQMSQSATGTSTLYDCPAQADFQIVAYDGNSHAISSLFAPNQTITSNGTVNLSALSFTAAPSRTYTFTNVPNAVGVLDVADRFLSSKGELGAVSGSAQGGPTATLTLKAPTFTNAVSLVVTSTIVARSFHWLFDWGPFSATYTTDVGARFLKEFTSDLTYSASTHAVTWTESTTGATPDFVELKVSGARGNEGFYINWDLIAPYSAGSATLPTLPIGTYDLNFSDTDSVLMELEQSKVPGGYDAVRAGFFVSQGPVGATGSAASVRFEPPPQALMRSQRRGAEGARPWFLRARR